MEDYPAVVSFDPDDKGFTEEEIADMKSSTESDLYYTNEYRWDKSGNRLMECLFGRLAIYKYISQLQGSVLTVAEASLQGEQLRAFKSLVNRDFSRKMSEIKDLAFECSDPYERKDGRQYFGNVLD